MGGTEPRNVVRSWNMPYHCQRHSDASSLILDGRFRPEAGGRSIIRLDARPAASPGSLDPWGMENQQNRRGAEHHRVTEADSRHST